MALLSPLLAALRLLSLELQINDRLSGIIVLLGSKVAILIYLLLTWQTVQLSD